MFLAKIYAKYLNSEDPGTRFAAAIKLAPSGNQKAIQVLVDALGFLTPPAMRATDVLTRKVGRDAIEPLINELIRPPYYLQKRIIPILWAIDSQWRASDSIKAGVPGIIEFMLSHKDAVTAEPVALLEAIGDPRAVEPLIQVLGSDNHIISNAAYRALNRIAPGWFRHHDFRSVVSGLVRHVSWETSHPPLDELAIVAWDQIRDGAIQTLADEDWRIRRGARIILCRWQGGNIISSLIPVLSNPRSAGMAFELISDLLERNQHQASDDELRALIRLPDTLSVVLAWKFSEEGYTSAQEAGTSNSQYLKVCQLARQELGRRGAAE